MVRIPIFGIFIILFAHFHCIHIKNRLNLHTLSHIQKSHISLSRLHYFIYLQYSCVHTYIAYHHKNINHKKICIFYDAFYISAPLSLSLPGVDLFNVSALVVFFILLLSLSSLVHLKLRGGCLGVYLYIK